MVWTTAIAVLGADPHAASVALGAAVVREVFDLLSARSHRASVLAYLGAAHANTHLDIGSSPATPALVLSIGSPGSGPPDDERAEPMPADEIPASGSGQDPGEFCVAQRGQWLAKAFTFTRNWPDAEDASSEIAAKVFEYHDERETLCPPGHDPAAWWMACLRNHLIDEYRKSRTRQRHARVLVVPAADIADQVTNKVIIS